MSKSRLANDPLETMFSDQESTSGKEKPATSQVPSKAKKVRVTFLLDDEVADRARDLVFFTPGETLAGFAEKALSSAISKAETERGEPFPKRHGNLPSGRPIK